MNSKKLKVLVIDDDDLITNSISMLLPNQWQAYCFKSYKEIDSGNYHAALIDMHLSGNTQIAEGIEICNQLNKSNPQLQIICMSGNLDTNNMEKCLKAGASRFLAKPLQKEELELIFNKIEALHNLKKLALRTSSNKQKQMAWLGQSTESQKIQKRIADLQDEKGPILIEGDTGTGKEVVARLLNQMSEDRVFISVNAAAIPENTFESEFFGHVKGAFTGADANKVGLAEAANHGDLFLDEIEALPLSIQAKLLRFLESGEIRRLGSNESMKLNVRFIAATNKNLEQMVNNKEFREDLLWRINGKKILLPKLKDRIDDIDQLAPFFIDNERPKKNKQLSPDALACLKEYTWPGNVRELKRTIEQLCLYSPLPFIRREDVLQILPNNKTSAQIAPIDLSLKLEQLLQNYEAAVIRYAIQQKKDLDDVAKLLGISRSTLYKKLKDFNIDTGT